MSAIAARVLRTLRRRGIRDSSLDRRRYWTGQPLASPRLNVPQFAAHEFDSRSITLERETRDCIELRRGAKFSIRMPHIATPGHLRLAVGASHDLADGSVAATSSGLRVAELSGLPGGRWVNASIPGELIAGDLEIRNTTSGDVYVAHPIFEEVLDPARHDIQNVIVIVLDSFPATVMGRYVGSGDGTRTPNIDRFFSDAIKYSRCYSIAEWTMPSLCSMFSSTYPITHGNTDLRGTVPGLSGFGERVLAHRMRALGFSTMACSGAKVFTPAFESHVGFQRFFYDPYPESGRTSITVTYRAIDHLEANRDGRNFLFLHYIDSHEWWDGTSSAEESKLDPIRIASAQREYESMQLAVGDSKLEFLLRPEALPTLNRRMLARVSEVDQHVQALFNYLEVTGLAKTSLVVLTADHGYSYLSGGKPLLTGSRVHVPLLIRDPRHSAQTVGGLINQGLDLGPTLLHLAGESGDAAPGNVMPPFVPGDGRTFVISESLFGDRYKVAVRTPQHVYHLHCRYDKSTRRICLDDILDEYLFSADSESSSSNVLSELPEVTDALRAHVIAHVVSNARFATAERPHARSHERTTPADLGR